jgi:hypothetical protein
VLSSLASSLGDSLGESLASSLGDSPGALADGEVVCSSDAAPLVSLPPPPQPASMSATTAASAVRAVTADGRRVLSRIRRTPRLYDSDVVPATPWGTLPDTQTTHLGTFCPLSIGTDDRATMMVPVG